MATARRIVIGCGHSTYPADNVNTVRVYDADLSPVWKYNHGATVRAVALDAEGNVYLGGDRVNSVTTRKLDQDGNLVWSKDHGATVYALAVDGDGAVYTGGARSSSVTTRQYAADGTAGWTADHGATVRSLWVDSSGQAYTAGTRFTASSPQGHVRHYNSAGTLQWTLDVGSSVDYLYGIAVDSSGNLYLTGYRNNSVTTLKYDSDRVQQWAVDEGGSGNAVTLDSSAVYTGFARNSSKSLRKRALTTGAETWVADTGATVDGVAVDADGQVYAVGSGNYKLCRFSGSGTLLDSVTLSFQAIYAVATGEMEIPDLSVQPPGLSMPLAVAVPFPTAILPLTAALALPWTLAPPAVAVPLPPVGKEHVRYHAYLGTPSPLALPLASFQCQRRRNESTWLTLTLPGISAAARAALDTALGVSVIVYAGLRRPDGTETLGEFLRAVITEVEIERDPQHYTARVTARIQVALEPLQTRAAVGVVSRTEDNGRRSLRCAVDPRLRPGDTVADGATTWVAHHVLYTVGPNTAWMEVQEAPLG